MKNILLLAIFVLLVSKAFCDNSLTSLNSESQQTPTLVPEAVTDTPTIDNDEQESTPTEVSSEDSSVETEETPIVKKTHKKSKNVNYENGYKDLKWGTSFEQMVPNETDNSDDSDDSRVSFYAWDQLGGTYAIDEGLLFESYGSGDDFNDSDLNLGFTKGEDYYGFYKNKFMMVKVILNANYYDDSKEVLGKKYIWIKQTNKQTTDIIGVNWVYVIDEFQNDFTNVYLIKKEATNAGVPLSNLYTIYCSKKIIAECAEAIKNEVISTKKDEENSEEKQKEENLNKL